VRHQKRVLLVPTFKLVQRLLEDRNKSVCVQSITFGTNIRAKRYGCGMIKGIPMRTRRVRFVRGGSLPSERFNLQVDTALDGLLHCRGPGSALVVTFTPSAARACAVMGETTPVRITL